MIKGFYSVHKGAHPNAYPARGCEPDQQRGLQDPRRLGGPDRELQRALRGLRRGADAAHHVPAEWLGWVGGLEFSFRLSVKECRLGIASASRGTQAFPLVEAHGLGRHAPCPRATCRASWELRCDCRPPRGSLDNVVSYRGCV